MTDTRPGEFGRAEARRIAQETADLLKIADNEREYREHVLVTLARMEVKQDNLQVAFSDHVKEDDARFGSVTQSIGRNSDWIQKGLGMAILLVAMSGVIMWIIDRMKP